MRKGMRRDGATEAGGRGQETGSRGLLDRSTKVPKSNRNRAEDRPGKTSPFHSRACGTMLACGLRHILRGEACTSLYLRLPAHFLPVLLVYNEPRASIPIPQSPKQTPRKQLCQVCSSGAHFPYWLLLDQLAYSGPCSRTRLPRSVSFTLSLLK